MMYLPVSLAYSEAAKVFLILQYCRFQNPYVQLLLNPEVTLYYTELDLIYVLGIRRTVKGCCIRIPWYSISSLKRATPSGGKIVKFWNKDAMIRNNSCRARTSPIHALLPKIKKHLFIIKSFQNLPQAERTFL